MIEFKKNMPQTQVSGNAGPSQLKMTQTISLRNPYVTLIFFILPR